MVLESTPTIGKRNAYADSWRVVFGSHPASFVLLTNLIIFGSHPTCFVRLTSEHSNLIWLGAVFASVSTSNGLMATNADVAFICVSCDNLYLLDWSPPKYN